MHARLCAAPLLMVDKWLVVHVLLTQSVDIPLARQTSPGLLFGLTALSCMTIRLHVSVFFVGLVVRDPGDPSRFPVGEGACQWLGACCRKWLCPNWPFWGIAFVGCLIQREETGMHTALQLKLSEQKYRQLYESIVDVSFEVDNHGVIQMVSPSVESILGDRPSEVSGQPIVRYCSPLEGKNVLLERERNISSI